MLFAYRADMESRALFVHKPEPSAGFVVSVAAIGQNLEATMHGIIYIIGLIVVIMAILSFFGLR